MAMFLVISSLLLLFPLTRTEPISTEDILNVEYLPSTLLLEEAVIEREMAALKANSTKQSSKGDIREAYKTMLFHREKMNEFMCRKYVADEILAELGEDETSRLGRPATNHRTSSKRDHLLGDQGSSSYKDWLSRSTLLDDVYRHYDAVMAGSDSVEEGEVTGYAVQGSSKTSGPSGGGHFSSGGGSFHGPPPMSPHSFSHPPPGTGGGGGPEEHYVVEESGGHGKSLALKDLFDLALTALAFLAFGVFVMNLIMTCMLGGQGTTIVMQTTTTTETGEAAKTRRRRRRSVEDELNQMAYRVSRSVESFLNLGVGQGCLRYALCRDNRYSRKLRHPHKIWLPLWSFGLSWVSGQAGMDRLANLRGAVLGLGSADCEEAYPYCAKEPPTSGDVY